MLELSLCFHTPPGMFNSSVLYRHIHPKVALFHSCPILFNCIKVPPPARGILTPGTMTYRRDSVSYLSALLSILHSTSPDSPQRRSIFIV